jgi:hypothetical protein
MKLGNQVINGFFEWNPDWVFTQGDLILRVYSNSGVPNSQIFYTKTEVTGVDPIEDVNETYFEDYFKRTYQNSDILTKSNIETCIQNYFQGISDGGIFTPINITSNDILSVNRSGVYKLVDAPDLDTYAIIYSMLVNPIMLILSPSSISFRVGTWNNEDISWGPLHYVSANIVTESSRYLNKLDALHNLYQAKILELQDRIDALSSLDTPFNVEYEL